VVGIDDSLIISDGGSTAVATDELFVQAALLGALATRAEVWSGQLRAIRSRDPTPAPAWAGDSSAIELFFAEREIAVLADDTARLQSGLIAAAEEYGRSERFIETLWLLGGQAAAWTLGRALPFIVAGALAVAIPAASSAAFGMLVSSWLTGRSPGEAFDALAGTLREHPRLLSDPEVVQFVRTLVASADDFAAGIVGLPAPVAAALGDTGIGLVGTPESAAAVIALAGLAGVVIGAGSGPLRETAVRVERMPGPAPPHPAAPGRPPEAAAPEPAAPGPASLEPVPPEPVPPPHTVEEFVNRIPPATEGSAQYRVDRFDVDGQPHWVLYIGGTIDTSITPGGQPLDMTSNIHAVGGVDPASERAALDALRLAGAAPGEPILALGHSQGGLIAARLAAAEGSDVAAYLNAGGPVGAVPAPEHVPGLSLEHADDLIPALGGPEHPPHHDGAGSAGRVTVSRLAADGIEDPEGMLPAHDLARYRETAALVDGSEEERLRSFARTVADFTGDAPGTSTMWRAERVSPSSPDGR
jgi:hypothetical protein